MPRRGSRFVAGRATNPLAARFREIERAIRRRQGLGGAVQAGQGGTAPVGGGPGGTTLDPSGSVVTEQSFGQLADGGSSNDYARADHTHGTPDDPCPCGCDSELVLSGGWWRTADHASLDIVADLDQRAVVALTDWTDLGELVSKWSTGGQSSWYWAVLADGKLFFKWTVDGVNDVGVVSSTVAPTVADGAILALRVTLDVNNGAAGRDIKFFTKNTTPSTAYADAMSNSGWTQLGATITQAGVTSIFSSTSPVTVGGYPGAPAADQMNGTAYAAVVKSDIDGTTVADPDFYSQPVGTTSFVDATGRTWTFEGQSAIPVECLADLALYDEGSFVGTVSELNFAGAGVTATASGNRGTVTIPAGAPSTVNYLVGTAHADLSAEIVVGTTPGGELGGTWASPTVDATHSGSTHAATQAAAESTAATALSGHAADTTSIHGIADTAQLALLTQIPAVVLKTADESVTSSTTLQDDNELSFAVSANSIYWFQFYIVYESTTAGDIKFQIVTTADEDRFSYSWPGNLASAAGAAYGSLGDYGASPSALPAQGLGVTVSVIAFAVGMLDTGASGGVVKLQWAQDTSNGTAAKVKTGSFVLYQKVV